MPAPGLDTLLFNTHDLVLLMAIGQYALLAFLLASTRPQHDKSSLWLILLLLTSLFINIDTLLIWSDSIRSWVLAWQPNLFFIGSLGYWLIGPFLLFYVRALLYPQRPLSPCLAAHFLPFFTVLLILLLTYYTQPYEEKQRLMIERTYLYSHIQFYIIALRNLTILGYGILCGYEVYRYRVQLKENYSSLETVERRWINISIIGFMTMSAWTLCVHLIGASIPLVWANRLGLVFNYSSFLFINTLIFLSLRYASSSESIDSSPHHKQAVETPSYKPEHIQRISQWMVSAKPYLQAEINLEQLASQLSLPERTLSRLLNQHFEKNFFEFINDFRLVEAERLLIAKEYEQATILEILMAAGFSSKSTFNALFKQRTGLTPSQYRKQKSPNKRAF